MNSQFATSAQIDSLRYLNDKADGLERRGKDLIRSLELVFNGKKSVGGLPTLTVSAEQTGRVLATVDCGFGKGRFVLSIRTCSDAEDCVVAQLVLERQGYDLYDRETWEPVMAVNLPRPDWMLDGMPIREDDRIFVFGASVINAIVNGSGEAEKSS